MILMIAEEYGQAPHEVAAWEPEWLAACLTVMSATNGAQTELQKRAERKNSQRRRA